MYESALPFGVERTEEEGATVMGPRILVAAGALIACAALARGARAEDPHWVRWSADWPRVGWPEVSTVVGLTAGSLAITKYWDPPKSPNWSQPILFDSAVRDALKGRSASAQSSAANLSDYLYKGAVLAPYVIDVYLVALGVHESAEVALQMLVIDMQSLGLAGVASLSTERLAARARPYVRDCRADGTVVGSDGSRLDTTCGGTGDYQSFYSGHSAATATMAGLTCVHHQHIPLYGGGVSDALACVFMVSLSLTTGVARVVADRHWASDVIVGWGVGAFSGYVLPSLLHYGFTSGSRPLAARADVRVLPILTEIPGGLAIGAGGAF